MAKRYDFIYAASGSEFIPVSDGDHEISGMSADFSTGQCYLQFYDIDKEPVAPDAGTVTFKASPFNNGQWLGSSNSADTINAVDVVVGDSSYTAPEFSGCVVSSKMTLSGIVGATYVSAYHWRE